MKIAGLETFLSGHLCFVKVTTDDGQWGMGQMSPYWADISTEVFHQLVAPSALGRDAGDIDAVVDKVIEDTYKAPGSFVCRALAGLDTALWDLKGRSVGKSVCELLGGKPLPVTVYGSSMRRDITPNDEAARLLRLRDEKGFRFFKVRVGGRKGRDQDEWPGRTDELVPTVAAALGEQAKLCCDGNSCYTAARAIEVGKFLEQHGVIHFEEPCPYWEYEWTRDVARALDLNVTGGEQDNYMPAWKHLIAMKAVDIVQPDICYLGGVSRTLRVASMAAEAGLRCVPHSANLSMVTLFTLHVMAAIPNAGPYVEFSVEHTAWTDGLFAPALEVVDGAVGVPDGPGWGVDVNAEWLARAQRRVAERT